MIDDPNSDLRLRALLLSHIGTIVGFCVDRWGLDNARAMIDALLSEEFWRKMKVALQRSSDVEAVMARAGEDIGRVMSRPALELVKEDFGETERSGA